MFILDVLLVLSPQKNFSFSSAGKKPTFEKGTMFGGEHPNYKADKMHNKMALKLAQNSEDCSRKVAGSCCCVNAMELPP